MKTITIRELGQIYDQNPGSIILDTSNQRMDLQIPYVEVGMRFNKMILSSTPAQVCLKENDNYVIFGFIKSIILFNTIWPCKMKFGIVCEESGKTEQEYIFLVI